MRLMKHRYRRKSIWSENTSVQTPPSFSSRTKKRRHLQYWRTTTTKPELIRSIKWLARIMWKTLASASIFEYFEFGVNKRMGSLQRNPKAAQVNQSPKLFNSIGTWYHRHTWKGIGFSSDSELATASTNKSKKTAWFCRNSTSEKTHSADSKNTRRNSKPKNKLQISNKLHLQQVLVLLFNVQNWSLWQVLQCNHCCNVF